MLSVCAAVLRRDLRLALRRRADLAAALSFFVVAATLFPLAAGSDPALLRSIGPAVVWVAALLASTLSLHRLFDDDYTDGTLEHMLLAAAPLTAVVAAKVAAHWLVTALPLVLMAPLMALQFGLAPKVLGALVAGLLLGTPVLSVVGAIGAALTLGVRGGGVLVALLVLPLYAPVLIFGAGAAANDGAAMQAHLLVLGAALLTALALAPWAVAAALRIALE